MRSIARRCFLFAIGLSALAMARPAVGQCATNWSSSDAWPGVLGTSVLATTMWDPDGSGPLTERFVLGGQFNIAGSSAAANIAMFDPVTGSWSPLGSGTNGAVRALMTLPNGSLVAGGDFTIAGGVATSGVARWNGTSWSSIGPTNPLPFIDWYSTYSLATLPNGDIVAGGEYMDLGGAVYGLMRWNGSTWSNFGFVTGSAGTVHVMRTMPNGDLVIAGAFAYVNGQSIPRIARWNGTSWSGFGPGAPVSRVYGLAVMPNGDICTGENYTPGWPPNAHRWNGSTWSQIGTGMNGSILAMLVLANGDLVATGAFTNAGGFGANSIARWDGTTWSSFGAGLSNGVGESLIVLPTGDLVVGGSVAFGVVKWNGTTWNSFGGRGLDGGSINSMTSLPDGDVVAGGQFVTADDDRIVNRIARSDGTTWFPLGAGSAAPVTAVTSLANGDVIASGSFTTPTGTHGIARWDGSAWTGLGSVTGAVWKLSTTGNGDVFAAGSPILTIGGVALHGLGRWNGSTWSGFGSGFNGSVYAVMTLPNGDVVAGGYFTSAGGTPTGPIARWNGVSWQPMGTGTNNGVHALASLPNGDIVAGGDFTIVSGVPISSIARWNGSTWSGLGTGMNARVDALLALPNGDVVAGGWFTTAGGTAANRIARWNGSSWSPIGSGLSAPCWTLSGLSSTGFAVAGSFTDAGGRVARGFARVVTTCPASSAVFGTGCPSSGGSNTLTADTQPWVDATFRATGTGLPTNALVLSLTSVASIPQGAVDLSSIFVEGIPGCDVLVAPDLLGALASTTGTATSSFFLPNTPSLAGVTLYHQLVPFEIGVSGFTAITATNALQLTAGKF